MSHSPPHVPSVRSRSAAAACARLWRVGRVGLVTGLLVLGVGGRVAMRLVALLTHRATHFSAEASLGILFIGAVLGAISSATFELLRGRGRGPWRPRVVHAPTATGLQQGTLLFGVLILLQPAAIRAEVIEVRGHRWAILALFWALCVAHAVIVARVLATRSAGRR